MHTLFHATSAAAAHSIESEGFKDADFHGVARGVFLSQRPLDEGDDVAKHCDAHFALEVPSGFPLDDFELINEVLLDDPAPVMEPSAIEEYREWLIPAAILNKWPRRRWIDQED